MTALPQGVVLTRLAQPPGQEPGTPDWASALSLLKEVVTQLKELVRLVEVGSVRERYTTEQVAKIFGKRPRTPQKWCRDRQVHCVRLTRDGTYRITSEEVERIRSHGLLPPGHGAVTEE